MAKVAIIQQVTDALLHTTDKKIISTWGHLKWNLEVIGQAFSLSLQNLPLMQNSFSLYRKWIMQEQELEVFKSISNSPNEQRLWITFAQHFSLVFESKPFDSDAIPQKNIASNLDAQKSLVESHLQLCERILELMSSMIRMYESKFTKETWLEMLKILFGIGDAVLAEPPSKVDFMKAVLKPSIEESKGEIMSLMGDFLCIPLIRVSFDSLTSADLRGTIEIQYNISRNMGST
jgi:hypothetical protein